MDKITIKNKEEIKLMAEGGEKLRQVKHELVEKVKDGVHASEIEKLAVNLIEKSGGKPSFMKVPGYHWATCINVNDGIVHGIPTSDLIFREGDIVSIDIGMFYKGFHTDTSTTIGLLQDTDGNKFIEAGRKALNFAIKQVKAGNYIYDISQAISDTITRAGYNPIKDLVGHGIGKNLHEDPAIPCIVRGIRTQSVKIKEGMTIAIEVMYAKGTSDLIKANDRWTIRTRDGKISGLFEDTVAVVAGGCLVLT